MIVLLVCCPPAVKRSLRGSGAPLACAWLMAAHAAALGNEEAAAARSQPHGGSGYAAAEGELAQVVGAHVAAGKTEEVRRGTLLLYRKAVLV